ncbi:MAG TPA: helix-turn-helix domain-containing protein [Candidatus Saccharimonadales bacterium]|nr:helix-turn-helix domain-containing protein [Candidatus Saccharimonadales bacterium]
MRLNPAVAGQITERAKTVLKRSVLVADAKGLVLSQGNYNGQILVDALRACQEGRVVRTGLGDASVAWCPFVYENQTVGAFGVVEEGAHTTPEAISLLQGLAEVITHQHFLLEHVQPSEKIRANFIKQVLTSTKIEAAEAYRQADILQINLRQPQAIILIEIERFEQDIRLEHAPLTPDEQEQEVARAASEITNAIQASFNNHTGNLACYIGNNIFVLSKGIGGEGLTLRNTMRFMIEKGHYEHDLLAKRFPNKKVSVGVGQYYPELGGLRKSFQEAKLSLTVGTKVWGTGRVYHIKQVGMFVTLANVAQERKAELAHQILYPLLKDEQLYKTVQTFLQAGLNLTEAAEKLHVHRNTLIYRLDKTKKVIGLDPRVFDDALQIKLGLMFYQPA